MHNLAIFSTLTALLSATKMGSADLVTDNLSEIIKCF